MYGLKQAGKLANELLATRLFGQGYYQCATTPGLWRHKWRPVIFALIVDDFGVQYTGRQHAEHLHAALSEHYEVTTDWTGTKFSGIDLKWDYSKRTCHLTMDGYIQDFHTRFGHPNPIKPQHSPHKHREIVYGAKAQIIANDIDDSPPLDAAGIKKVQGIVGCILYYARPSTTNYSAQSAPLERSKHQPHNTLLPHATNCWTIVQPIQTTASPTKHAR